VRWKVILRIPNRRREKDPPDLLATTQGIERTSQGYRIVWIRSSQKAQDDRLSREGQLRKAEAELADLNLRLNRRRLRSRRAIRAAYQEILKRLGVAVFLKIDLGKQTQLIPRRLRRGRPGPKDPVRMEKRVAWRLSVKRDTEALAAEKRTDGVFPLLTNLLKHSKREVLLIYKHQPYVEKRFASFKSELEIAPVYLKKPNRAAALVHAYFLALVVANLIEREVCQALEREKIEALPLLPEGRMTKTPTCPRVLEALGNVGWQEFERGDEVIAFPIELTPLQKELFRLMRVPLELYR
jgi:transposase